MPRPVLYEVCRARRLTYCTESTLPCRHVTSSSLQVFQSVYICVYISVYIYIYVYCTLHPRQRPVRAGITGGQEINDPSVCLFLPTTRPTRPTFVSEEVITCTTTRGCCQESRRTHLIEVSEEESAVVLLGFHFIHRSEALKGFLRCKETAAAASH